MAGQGGVHGGPKKVRFCEVGVGDHVVPLLAHALEPHQGLHG